MTNTLFELNVQSTHYNTANTVSLMLLTGSIMGLPHNGSPFLGHTKSFFWPSMCLLCAVTTALCVHGSQAAARGVPPAAAAVREQGADALPAEWAPCVRPRVWQHQGRPRSALNRRTMCTVIMLAVRSYLWESTVNWIRNYRNEKANNNWISLWLHMRTFVFVNNTFIMLTIETSADAFIQSYLHYICRLMWH